jgi:hypothetical protein
MSPPSTAWKEQQDGDEEKRFADYAERIAAIQKKKSQKFGNGRAFHRKQLIALRARFEVLPDLPPHAAQGRVLGVTGAGALGGTTRAQDFVLINRQVFGFSKPDDFIELVLALFNGPLSLVGYLVRRYGVLGGLKRIAEVAKSMKRPFAGFAGERFFSAAPIANGPYAVRVRLEPEGTPAAAGPGAAADWAADMRAHLQRGPLVYRLQLQFFTDEKCTPIEDANVDWAESGSPYVTVGRLTIPQQSFDDAEAQKLAREVDQATFDPWEALVEHRPLGGIMRARKAAYFASQKTRGVVS